MNLPSVASALALFFQVAAAASTTPVRHAASTAGPPVASSPLAPLNSVLTVSTTPSSAATPRASSFSKRAAIPECLKNVELSCLNMAANCIDSVGMDTSFINNLWGVKSCVAAATCYGVGDLITSVECQTGLSTTTTAQASLDYDNIYASIVGSCAFAPGGCPITQQNYIDFYYGELTAINTANFPSSSAVVIAWWDAITVWAATGPTVPYLNFNDWLHFSSAPSTTTSVAPPVPSFTQIEWNPNPAPPPGAVSETFVTGTSTVIVAVPSTTTVVVIATATITLAPGGTPINGPVPSGISQPGATTPTWNPNIIPPTSVSSVTFTAPPSYTTVVAVPTASNSPPKNITGPPGDKNSNGDDWWLLLFPGIIGGLLPPDIGIPGGSTPTAAQPADWTGSWVDPDPTSTSTASQSSTSGAACSQPTAGYSLPDDPENADWEDEGTDPDRKKKRDLGDSAFSPVVRSSLERRADPRSIGVNVCSIVVVNSVSVSLVAGQYWSIGTKVPIGTGSTLSVTQVNSRPAGNGPNTVAQEHIFELGYINQFFQVATTAGVACTWIQNNVFSFTRRDGSNLGVALLNAIDTVANMVWVDKPLNQAKSNVVNQNKATAASPPQSNSIDAIVDFKTSLNQIQDVEYFIRNFGALGAYFGNTATIFQATALRVQNLLAEITPNTPDANLPVEFNGWLRSLVATYPNGCTSRATNTYNYYVAKMNTIKTSTNPVPDCDFPLYKAGITPQSFTFGNLIPPAPTLPACDIPGTQGTIILGQDSQGNDVAEAGVFRTMGSGNTQFYALGSGASLVGIHWVAKDLSTVFPNCGGAFEMQLQDPSANLPDANIALNCNGQNGNKVRAPFNFVFNNQILQCVLLNHNDGTNQFDTICSSSTAAAGTCGNSAIQAQLGTFPLATLSTTNYAFLPM